MPTKASSHGRTYTAIPFEVVPLPLLPAHNREQAEQGVELADYLPWGNKGQLARAYAKTQPAELEGMIHG